MRAIKIVSIFFLVVFFSGCGTGNKKLTGKITYPDDSPVTQGFVFFDSLTSQFQARGEIMQDGTYTVGSVTSRDGIPPGEYAVYVISERRGDSGRMPLVAPKYNSGTTSGIVCKVPAPKNQFDFTVEPFEGRIKGDPLKPMEIKPVPTGQR